MSKTHKIILLIIVSVVIIGVAGVFFFEKKASDELYFGAGLKVSKEKVLDSFDFDEEICDEETKECERQLPQY